MHIKTKYELGDKIYFPGNDMADPHIKEGVVSGLGVYVLDGKEVVKYGTDRSPWISEEFVFANKVAAKKKLIKMMKQRKIELVKQADDVINAIKDMKPKDITRSQIENETKLPTA